MDSRSPEQAVFAPQVLDLLASFGEFGKSTSGGITRLAASEQEKQARDHLCRWLRDHDIDVAVDAIGNIFGVLDLGTNENDRAFFCGSHLDSQPNGGNFDGCLGVVCACVAALELRDRISQSLLSPTFRYFVVVCWTGEEGARFQPSLIGSSVFTGTLDLDVAYGLEDADGVSLSEALQMSGYLGSDEGPRPDFYLELHIEQGTLLESAGHSIGLVDVCWGAEKVRLLVTGSADHTGPTPMETRRNALLAASKVILTVEAISKEARQMLHSSVGRMELSPNSPNTIVERAELWVEFRSPSDQDLQLASRKLDDALELIGAATGCSLSITQRERREAIQFDESALQHAARALDAANLSHQRMKTIAGHDAVRLQAVCPSALLFVPSKDGVTHAPEEFTTDEDVLTGFEGMMAVLSDLIARPVGDGPSAETTAMKRPGSPDNPMESSAEAALNTFETTKGAKTFYAPSVGSVVSPIHRGVESACFDVDVDGRELFLKVRYPDMSGFFDESIVHAGAQCASTLGVGARLVDADEASGSYLFERLDETWSWGKMDDFGIPSVLENTVSAKQAIHRSASLSSGQSVFETIEDYHETIRRDGIKIPKTAAGVLEGVRDIERAISASGIDLVSAHGDGVSSNVMISV